MPRFYADENFPQPAVDELRRLGCEVVMMRDLGRAGQAQTDEAVLSFAAERGLILLTLNRRHFVRLHELSPNHSGIVVCSFDPDFKRLAASIYSATNTKDDLPGKLLRINRPA